MPTLRILLALAAAAIAVPAHAQDNKITVQNKIAQCQGCHGIKDWKTAFPEIYRVPKLGGQKTAYIVAALKQYKSGERDFATMRAIAADLTDEQMQAVARYYGDSAPVATAETKK